MNLKQIVSQKIYTAPLSELPLDTKCIINTINPHSYCEAKKDSAFTDVLLPDVSGIALAAKVLNGKKIKKLLEPIHQLQLEQVNTKRRRVFI